MRRKWKRFVAYVQNILFLLTLEEEKYKMRGKYHCPASGQNKTGEYTIP